MIATDSNGKIQGFDLTDYYCPRCGLHNVFQSRAEADYYEGAEYLCGSCLHVFTMPKPPYIDRDSPYVAIRLEVLRPGGG